MLKKLAYVIFYYFSEKIFIMKKLFLLLCLTLCTIFYGANLTSSAVVEATVSETTIIPTQKNYL